MLVEYETLFWKCKESQHVADRNRVPSEEELEEAKAWLNSLEEKLNECPEVCNK
mgnify:CR=1 FL=1